jgi:hypothetical protein
VDNSGDLHALTPQLDALWEWLGTLPQLPADYVFAPPRDTTGDTTGATTGDTTEGDAPTS